MLTWEQINDIARKRNFSLYVLWQLSQEMKTQCNDIGLTSMTEIELEKLMDLHLRLCESDLLGDPALTIEVWAMPTAQGADDAST